MHIKNILVPVTGETNSETAIHMAAQLSLQHKAHLTGLHVRPDPTDTIPIVGEGLSAAVVQELTAATERDGKKNAETAKKLFQALIEKEGIKESKIGVGASFETDIGFFHERLARRARVADLTVLPKEGKATRGTPEFLKEVLFRSGRPILQAGQSVSPLDKVLVTWNGSAEAARAVDAALPFLYGAKSVTALTIGNVDSGRPGLKALGQYLENHNISTKLHNEEDQGDDGAHILDYAKSGGFNLVVLGAYSHSRWREMVLGGATRHIIHESDLPLLIHH